MKKASATMLATVLVHATACPTLIIHGPGDACANPGMKKFLGDIAVGTKDYTACIETGTGTVEDKDKQVEMACAQIEADGHFAGEVNVIGLSQGGFLGRSIIQQCGKLGKVRKFMSIGGPLMGTADVPGCSNGNAFGTLNWDPKSSAFIRRSYTGRAESFWVRNQMKEYMADAKYIMYASNHKAEQQEQAALFKARFSDLEGVMLVKFNRDSVLCPKETEWFQGVDNIFKQVQMRSKSTWYAKDTTGLKALVEAGKVAEVEINGDHLQFSESDMKNTFIPFLKSRRLLQQESGVQAKAVMV